jgi:hypothetical protein
MEGQRSPSLERVKGVLERINRCLGVSRPVSFLKVGLKAAQHLTI